MPTEPQELDATKDELRAALSALREAHARLQRELETATQVATSLGEIVREGHAKFDALRAETTRLQGALDAATAESAAKERVLIEAEAEIEREAVSDTLDRVLAIVDDWDIATGGDREIGPLSARIESLRPASPPAEPPTPEPDKSV